MLRWIKRIVGGIFFISSALGLFGIPADLPTWYRCIRFGDAKCAEALTAWSPPVDGSVVFNVASLLIGILLLLSPSRPRLGSRILAYRGALSTGGPDQTKPKPPRDRFIVDITAEQLMGLYENHTSMQGAKLAEP